MKKCPFCKKDIESSSIKCQICRMALAEKIPTEPKEEAGQKQQTWQYTDQKTTQTKSTNSNFNFKGKGLLISLGLSILLSFVLSHGSGLSSKPAKPLPTPETLDIVSPMNVLTTTNTPEIKPILNPLLNGVVLKKDTNYFNGKGILTIKNGSGSDAVVKLIPSNVGKSVYTVYISNNKDFSIKQIKDGDYRLLFSFGSNWDTEKKIFINKQGSEFFDDSFEYTTIYSEDYIDYGTYTVTLNPVVGGNAKTTPIDKDLFDQY